MENTVYDVPQVLDNYVANLKLETMGIKIDELTEEQKVYIDSYEGE